jgi:TonB family protein
MSARRSSLCAVGRAILVLISIAGAGCYPGVAQFLPAAATEQPLGPIGALAERLAVPLLAAGKKKPYILDLSLANDQPCPLGVWLADRLSESLAHAHPELEVIARDRWNLVRQPAEFAHDRNQEYAQNEQRAQSLGVEVLIQGSFAAVPGGIGITLIASDHLAGGESQFEALAEIPITSEMQAILTSSLPQRAELEGAFRASVGGIGSPLCKICPAPEYTYVAKAKKLQGVVITQLRVNTNGSVENVKIVRTPNPALSDAAVRSVRNWRFRAARNAQGESVSVIVDVAVAFRLDVITPDPLATAAGSAKSRGSVATAKVTCKKF